MLEKSVLGVTNLRIYDS